MSAEKSWEGIGDLELTPEIKVTISGTASLLTLGFAEPYYFDRIHTIIVHTGAIRNRQMRHGYVVDPDDEFFAGQAWQGGPIILAWSSVIDGIRHSGSGHNVVVHEFAHHIDGLDGEMGGMPEIESPELRERWKTVFARDFQSLVSDIHHDRQTLIDPYAGTNPAEFFAVTSELFFDSPHFLRERLPDVYECLAAFYRLDPLSYANDKRNVH